MLGEDVTADELGGPNVHSETGVTDFVVEDEVAALLKVKELLKYLPNNNAQLAPYQATSDSLSRATWDIDIQLKKAFNSPSGMNTPLDIGILVQQICDHGDYLEVQETRARNTVTALGRLGGNVVGFVANNSAVSSGQIDIQAAYKNARFVRFCNLYNIPMIFIEDTTGFLPGSEQESGGIVQAGRAMLDAIIDVRTPRFLLIVRNAFGGAYAAFNSYETGADFVVALPTTRLAVMGPAGVQFVYKDELRQITKEAQQLLESHQEKLLSAGVSQDDALLRAKAVASNWIKDQEALLQKRYEDEIMNPKEALSLGSVSQIAMPHELRSLLGRQLESYLKTYEPGPLTSVQREFH